MNKLFGYVPDPKHTELYVSSLPFKRIPDRLIRQKTQRDVLLWLPKNTVQPNWRRGAQDIGDCVSWGAEIVCTCTLWNKAVRGEIQFEAEAATESIYGFCRVELHGKPVMGLREDGAAGSWAAEAMVKFGVLLRKDYSIETGNPEHDLRKYSGQKAQQWGYYGNGGRSDGDKLDEIARNYPVQEVVPIYTPDEADAAIDAGMPITVASMVGFEGNRDNEGIIKAKGQWPHQMAVLGKKFTPGGNRLWRFFNSWNGSVSGPDPGIDDKFVSECSWWTDDASFARCLRDRDTFAYGPIKGLDLPPYDFDTQLLV